MSQPLTYDEIEMWLGHPVLYVNKLEEISYTPGDSDIGYFIEVDSRYSDNKKEKTENFANAPENKIIHKDKFNDYMRKIKPKKFTKAKKLICDWYDKKNYLTPFRMLNFFVSHRMVVERVNEIISFKQSKWFEKIYILIHSREIRLNLILKKISINYSKKHFVVKEREIYKTI